MSPFTIHSSFSNSPSSSPFSCLFPSPSSSLLNHFVYHFDRSSSLQGILFNMPDDLLGDQGDAFITRSRRVSMMIEKGVVNNLHSYPKSVFYILGNEFCERFSFYGMRAILMVYFQNEHHHNDSTAAFLFHLFTCIAYFTPLLGSIIADSYLGRFKVILYVSIVYVFGHLLLSFGSIHTLPWTIRGGFDYSGLLIIAICTGGIKPCVSAFAADQFNESQKEERAQFFSFFYFAINAGSLFALALIPYLRGGIQCFGRDCFPLAFGVPGILMLIALIIFLIGWKYYKKTPPSRENIAWRVAKCIGTAISKKMSDTNRASKDKGTDWLEYAHPEYSHEMIKSVRSFIDVAIIFMPLVLFWALFDQQASTWVIQAQNMNCRIGSLTIMAEQMSFINPLLIVTLVPLFEVIIYPSLKKILNITPLRKMAVGGIITSLSFLVAGILQFGVNKTLPNIPLSNEVSLFMTNNTNIVQSNGVPIFINDSNIIPAESYSINNITLDLSRYAGRGVLLQPHKTNISVLDYKVEKPKGTMNLYLLIDQSNDLHGEKFIIRDSNGKQMYRGILETSKGDNSFIKLKLPIISIDEIFLYYGRNCSHICEHKKLIKFGMGSLKAVYFNGNKIELIELIPQNGMSLLWTIPQYILITTGEILISVTGLEFAYSQASSDMKSVLQAVWLITVCLGNIIDMAISGSHIVEDPSMEFFLYSTLMMGVMILFILLATRYKYKDLRRNEEKREELIDNKKNSSIALNTLTISSIDTPL